jgi:hypothetical protein
LKSTGLAEDWSKGDRWEWVPFADRAPAAWQDTIWVDLVTDWALEDEDATPEEYRRAEELAEDAASVIKKLVRTRKEVRWTTVEEEYAPMTISLWLKPADALAAYERIVADPSRAWLHGEDNHGFLCSSWETPITERLVFLVPGVREATVRCEYYSSPERLVAFSR